MVNNVNLVYIFFFFFLFYKISVFIIIYYVTLQQRDETTEMQLYRYMKLC